MQPWWLDAVCGAGQWQVSLARQADGAIIGALPYCQSRRWGLQFIKMPPLTDYAGPLICYPEHQRQSLPNRYAFEKKVLNQIIQNMPRVHFFNQQFYPGFEDGLPFFWQGFRLMPLYTYYLDGGLAPETLFENMKGSVRTDIRKAQEQLQIFDSEDIQAFIDIHQQGFKRQHKPLPYPPEALLRLDAALRLRGQCRLWMAASKDSSLPQAGLYAAWDQQTAYLLLCGIDEKIRAFGALQWLYWEAIQYLSGRVQTIDFCGSVLEPVEHATRAFGARRVMHLRVYKAANPLLRMLSMILGKGYD